MEMDLPPNLSPKLAKKVGTNSRFLACKEGAYCQWCPDELPMLRQGNIGAAKLDLEKDGFALPRYSDSAKVAYVLQGNGVAGIVLPEKEEKVLPIKKGDAIALPFGVITWSHNKEDTKLVVLSLGNTSKAHRSGSFTDFFLTGSNGIFTGFSPEFLDKTLKMPEPNEEHQNGMALNCEEPLDVDIKRGGRVVVLNTKNLPLVGEVRLGDDLVVGVDGKRILETTIKGGDLFIVPRFFVASKIADPDGMEWFSIITTPDPIFTHLAGSIATWMALSPEVVRASFNIGSDREMAPLKSLEREFSIIDSNFQQFCASHGIFSVGDFLIQDLCVLVALAEQHPTSERLKEGITQVLSIIDSQHQPWFNGMDLLEDAQQNKHILSTGCERIDMFLQGGLREGHVTELVGPSSSYKTQVCLQVASNVAKMGGVVFLDTGNSFSPKRIAQFLISDPAGKETCGQVRLLIVDSISSLITPVLGGSGSHGHALMISAGSFLKRLAHEHNLAVLIFLSPGSGRNLMAKAVTNHVVGGEGGALKPALGESWKSIPHVRLQLSREHGSNLCSMCILAHPYMSFNTRLNVLVDNGRLEDANEMFKCSSKMGFRSNSVSFNIMIKGWLERGEWEEARRVFHEMLEREVEPSVVTYNSLIGYLCKRGDLDKAKGLLDDMEKPKRGHLCVVDGRFVLFRQRGMTEEAKGLFLEMKERQLKPVVVTYNILIDYLCKQGRAAEAYKILVEMQVRACEPNAATNRMMVDGFCQVKEFEGGLKVLNAMLNGKHCPRLETFFCLIKGLVKLGKVSDACFVLEEMEKRKMRFELESWEVLVRDNCSEDGGISSLAHELISAH
ncbi:RmlC-like cupins superfamily protein [Actinidia rufa]|uniref:RmlC-like cupins superfamily protein n=1 Tax=Actinidia rufa TaxID=165716 RepID=A0A7J0DAJ9_9ERIC|nr:RmlC-like cupins superfamily protein [Actinidia rufa]